MQPNKRSITTTDVFFIITLFYMLFLGGCQQLQSFVGTNPTALLTNALNPTQQITIITATPRLISQPVDNVVSSPRHLPVIDAPPTPEPITIIYPASMPHLPTATPTFEVVLPSPLPTEVNVIDWYATSEQATVDAWIAATSTPWPEPGEEGFVESFATAEPCSPFIGYLGADKVRCDAVFATQTAEVQ